MTHGPRIYNLFPLLAGDTRAWQRQLPRIAALGFDWIYLNPFHYPGFSGSLYAVKDTGRLHPRMDAGGPPDEQLRAFTDAAAQHGIQVMMDLVINHTSKDALLVDEHPEWYVRDDEGNIVSPHAIDPADANNITEWGDLAELDWSERPERQNMIVYFGRLIRHYVELGFAGFRCDAAYKLPGEAWKPLIDAAREVRSDAVFAAETLGCRLEEVEQLRPAGFDYLFNSAKWWDFKGDWLLDQYEQFRHIAPSIAFPESHDTERLVAALHDRGVDDPAVVEACYKRLYLFAATFSTGVMMPMGYEHGYARRLDVVQTHPEHAEAPRFDLSGFISEVNALKAAAPALNEEGPQKRLAAGDAVALLRKGGGGWALTVINPSEEASAVVHVDQLDLPDGDATFVEMTPGRSGATLSRRARLVLGPAEARVFATGVRQPEKKAPPAERPRGHLADTVRSERVIIETVRPEIDSGRYPIKREVGDVLRVQASIFSEGHDLVSAALLYRRKADAEWLRTPMVLVDQGMDLWEARFPLEENTRYVYTIEAWRDDFATWRSGLIKKIDAGQEVHLEVLEGRDLVARAAERAGEGLRASLQETLQRFDAAPTDAARREVMLSRGLEGLMRRWVDPEQAVRYDRELEVIVDRVIARYAAWYEMFPRSQGTDPSKSATFKDCEARLPEIEAMGFDVIYFVPIHPIGRTHRKGPDNTLNAGPDDPGSPYAIGSKEGGHKAVHPELGTLEDFRHFVGACRQRGFEVALDLAIQAAPDHPWITEHPEWFDFRPDGTIKYAENPPKKYQDIVNVQFYGPGRESLWYELRDTVLFWVDQGVTIFRVDNPHTKPVPFWEWMIAEVQKDHPEVIFLSEAFTRPGMVKMLAKVGFTQSYTYFTWRNFKRELTDYLTELTQTEVKEYLRPNFFPSTPDILPRFLQEGGRPAFRIRAVLAATLSSVYGIYNGFELCENAAVEGKEEYLHSEKYEFKVWDWDRPGNIKDWLTAINRIRRENPALHELENLRFYEASSEHVLFYGKMSYDRSNQVFMAVNLDPFDAHSATLTFPLQEMGIKPDATFEVEELFSGTRHLWQGAEHKVTLDPEHNPAVIYRIVRWEPVDYASPSY